MTDHDKALELLEQAAATCASEQPQGQKLTYEVLRDQLNTQIALHLERDGQTFNGTLDIGLDSIMMQRDPLQYTQRLVRKSVSDLRDRFAETGSSPS